MASELRQTLKCQISAVSCLCLSPDGKYGIIGCEDRTLRLFNPRRSDPQRPSEPLFIHSYGKDHIYPPLDVQISRDSARMVSGARDKVALLWDVAKAQSVCRFRGHSDAVHSVAFCGEGDTILATGSADRTVCLWDLRSGNLRAVQSLCEARDAVTHVRVNGTEIRACSIDGVLRTYDVRTGRVTADSIGEPITGLAVNVAGDRVFLACLGSAARLLDCGTGNQVNAFTGHKHAAYHLRGDFAFDGQSVAMGSEDGRVLVWDVSTGELVQTFDECHQRPVTCVERSSMDWLMVSGAYDGTLQVYDKI